MRILLTYIIIALLCIPATSLAQDKKSSREMSDYLLGKWEGNLEIIHAPIFLDRDVGFLKYRFEFTKNGAEISMWHEEKWFDFVNPVVISQQDVNNSLVLVLNTTDGYIETFTINLIQLDSDTLYAYISRVVNNYNLDKEDPHRHYPVFVQGKLTKQ